MGIELIGVYKIKTKQKKNTFIAPLSNEVSRDGVHLTMSSLETFLAVEC